MNILVTGGTGTVGIRLVNLLSKKNRIFVLTRKDMKNKENVYYLNANLCNKESLVNTDISGIDIVYHLAANMDENDKNMYDENIESTKNIIELCKKANIKQIIFMSSSGVLGETKSAAEENFPYNPLTTYEKSKMECELLTKNSGLIYTIIRASIIIAPNNIWKTIIGAAKKGFPIIGSGKNKFHLTYVDDVVSLLLLVKNNDRAKNQIFHVATKDTPIYNDVYNIICDELKCKMTKKHLPVFFAKLMLFFRGDSVINNSTVDRLIRNRELSIIKTKTILGFEPKYTTQQAIKETIKYLRLLKLGYSEHDIVEMSLIK